MTRVTSFVIGVEKDQVHCSGGLLLCLQECVGLTSLTSIWGDMAQEVRAVVWQSEGCRFDPTLGVSKCP